MRPCSFSFFFLSIKFFFFFFFFPFPRRRFLTDLRDEIEERESVFEQGEKGGPSIEQSGRTQPLEVDVEKLEHAHLNGERVGVNKGRVEWRHGLVDRSK